MKKAFDDTWEEIHKSGGWGKYPSESVIRFVARNYYNVPCRSDIKILDFGCGGGANTWFLCREGFDTYAFDGAETAVQNTRQYLADNTLLADLRVLDGINTDYKNEFFNAIIDNVCIYANTYNNILDMYQECYRILKNGGKLYTSVFTKNTEGFGTGEKIEEDTYKNMTSGRLEGRGTAHFFDKESFADTLTKCGFKIENMDVSRYEDMGVTVEQLIGVVSK